MKNEIRFERALLCGLAILLFVTLAYFSPLPQLPRFPQDEISVYSSNRTVPCGPGDTTTMELLESALQSESFSCPDRDRHKLGFHIGRSLSCLWG